MTLFRVPTWDVDLEQWAAGLIGTAFVWGETDCASLVVKGQRLIYGVDVFHVDTWKTKAKALRILTERDGLPRVMRLHCKEVGRRFLRAGDIVLVGHGCTEFDTDGMLLVIREYALATSPELGVIAVPLDAMPTTDTTYWRIDVD